MMATKRLTVGIRDDIVSKMMNINFGKSWDEKNAAKRLEAGLALYDLLYSEIEQAAMNKLPAGWLSESNRMEIRTGSCGWRDFSFSQDKSLKKRFLSKHRGCIGLNNDDFPEMNKLACIYIEWQEERDVEKKSARKLAEGILMSVTTVNRAIEIWPEAESIIREVSGAYYVSNLPAPKLHNLNKRLGLPPESECA